jgi:hypothetical protein
MTMLSAIASPGQRWKMFLPGAASTQCDVLNVSVAAALIRSQWLSDGAHRSPPQLVAGYRRSGLCRPHRRMPESH